MCEELKEGCSVVALLLGAAIASLQPICCRFAPAVLRSNPPPHLFLDTFTSGGNMQGHRTSLHGACVDDDNGRGGR